MFSSGLNLDLSGVKEQTGFEPLPAGEYVAMCTEAELKSTRSGNGQYIKCELTVQEGEYTGRKLWTNFNIANDSVKATEIGLGQLKSFVKCATGSEAVKLANVSDLIGLQAIAVVKVKRDDQYGDSNVVSYFKAQATATEKPKTAAKKKNPFA